MEAMTTKQLRYRATKRAPLRDFSARGMARWLTRNRIDWTYDVLADGRVRIVATPALPVDRLALCRFGFSTSRTHGTMYRTAERLV